MYGKGATYDSIEGQFRKVKALANQLVEENQDGVVAPTRKRVPKTEIKCSEDTEDVANESTTTTPKKTRKLRTPSKNKDTVISGRVSKNHSTTTTPTRTRKGNANADGDRNAVKGVKEDVESSGSSFVEGMLGMRVEELAEGLGWDDLGGFTGEYETEEV